MTERHDHDPASARRGAEGRTSRVPGAAGAGTWQDDERLAAAADRLRAAAEARASAVRPAGTWEHVQHRLAFERRRRRNLRVAAGSVVAAAALVLGLALAVPALRSDPTQRVDTAPADDPSGLPDPGTTEPDGAPVPDPTLFPGIWPVSSQEQLDAYVASGSTEWAEPVPTAVTFMQQYVGMLDPEVLDTELGRPAGEPATPDQTQEVTRDDLATVTVRPAGVPSGDAWTRVKLQRLGGEDGPWVVVHVAANEVRVGEPAAHSEVRNPVAVAGEATGYEGTVVVTVRDDTGAELGQVPFIAGTLGEMGPFAGEVAYRAPSTPAGALLFTTDTGRDGVGVPAATVLRVAFADWQPAPEASLYALTPVGIERWTSAGGGREPRSVLVLGEEHLGQGAQDLVLAPDRSALYFSRGVTGCLWEIVTVPLDAEGAPAGDPEVVTAGTAPAISPDGTWLAYAVDDDCDGHDELVLRDLTTGEEPRRWSDGRDRHETWSRVTSISFVDIQGDLPTLVFSLLAEHAAGVRVLDDPDARSVLDSREIGPGRSGHADSDVVEWVAPRWDPGTGRLYVVEECCELNVRDRFRVLAVDIDSPDEPAVLLETGIQLTRVVTGRDDPTQLLVTGDGRVLRFDLQRATELIPAVAGAIDAAW